MPASPPYDDGNGRVTLAVLGSKLDALTVEVQRLCDKTDRRISNMEEKFDLRCDKIEGEAHENRNQIARLEERQKSTTGILTGVTLALSTVAGFVGAVFK